MLKPGLDDIEKFLIETTQYWGDHFLRGEVVLEISAIDEGGRRQKSFCFGNGWARSGAEWAVAQNMSGANVYWVPQPKSAKATSRCANDDDIKIMPFVFLDQDDEDAVAPDDLPITPAFQVTTGTVPFERRHLYFALAAPLEDQDVWRDVTLGAIRATNSDKACQNPSRLMRLPGTVSYPPPHKKKRGYVDELVTWDASNAATYQLDEIVEAIGMPIPAPTHSEFLASDMADVLDDVTRFVKTDRKLTQLLNEKRNTLPAGSYANWRNVCFGVRQAYKGTPYEREAYEAFVGWSERWENGETKRRDIDKLWNSEHETGGPKIGPGTAVMILKKMPPCAPAAEFIAADEPIVVDPQASVLDIRFTGLAGGLQEQLGIASDRLPCNIHIGGVLAALSALIGPSAVIQNGVKGQCATNLYLLALGKTGVGKETIRTMVSSVIHCAGRDDEAFSASPSDVSCHSALAEARGRMALMIDEAGILAKAMKSHSQSHQRLLMSFLMQVYGRGLTRIEARSYRDKKNNIEAVEKPRPTVMLTSTVADFTGGTSQEESASGFFNRFLAFVDEGHIPYKDRNDIPDNQAIVAFPEDIEKAIKRMRGEHIGPSLPQRLPNISVLLSDDALEMMKVFKYDEVEKHLKLGGLKAETWTRAAENAQRIAGLLAVSDALMVEDSDLENVECTLAHVEMALSIVRHGLAQLEKIAASAGQTPSRLEKLKDRVIHFLSQRGGSATLTEINRSVLRGMRKDERDELLDAMVSDGEILYGEAENDGRRGPKAEVYFLPNSAQSCE